MNIIFKSIILISAFLTLMPIIFFGLVTIVGKFFGVRVDDDSLVKRMMKRF